MSGAPNDLTDIPEESCADVVCTHHANLPDNILVFRVFLDSSSDHVGFAEVRSDTVDAYVIFGEVGKPLEGPGECNDRVFCCTA